MTVIETLELKRQERQLVLDGERSQAARNQLGQFATPEALAIEMALLARELWRPRTPLRFLDPAIGSGSFYSAVRRVFPRTRVVAAAGVEVDPRFARAARGLWAKTGLRVKEADFTRLDPPPAGERATLVIANPPYVRHHHVKGEDKERLKAQVASTLGLKISGLAGLYVHFLLLSHRWMAPGGLALWLIPSEFLDVNYGVGLREYLRQHVTLLRLHRFDPADPQFSDALVSSAVIAFRSERPPADHAVRFTYGGTLRTPAKQEGVPLRSLPASAKWSAFPTRNRASAVEGPPLSEFFSVKRGIATGANEFFVLPRERVRELRIPDQFLRPILPSPRRLKDAVIEADPDGYPRLDDQLALIDCGMPEEELRAVAPSFLAYLKSGEESGVRDRYLVTRRFPWYRQEQRAPAPFLCTYMGRGVGERNPFRFIWNKSRAIAANVYLLLYPVGPMKAALQHDPGLHAAVFDVFRAIAPETLRGGGRVYGGALHKLEPGELGQLDASAFAALIPPRFQASKQIALALG